MKQEIQGAVLYADDAKEMMVVSQTSIHTASPLKSLLACSAYAMTGDVVLK